MMVSADKLCSRIALSIACFLSLHPSAHGESSTELESVVVTAARGRGLLEHMPGDVAVIRREEIEGRNIQRITDTLNLLPGVSSVVSKGIQQPTSGISIRGVPDERRTLVLLDGVPLSDGYAGSLSVGGIPVGLIEQTEVLYGPMSSLYGGNAMGGVINFVSRRPKQTEYTLDIGYGNPFTDGAAPKNIKKTFASFGTRLDNDLSILVTGNRLATDGYASDWVTSSGPTPPAGTSGAVFMATKTGDPGWLIGKKGSNRWEEEGYSLRLEQKLADGSRWRASWNRQKWDYGYGTPQTYLRTATGAPSYSTPSLYSGGDSGYLRETYSAGIDKDVGAGRLTFRIGHSKIFTNYYITPTSATSAFGGTGRISDSPSQTSTVDSYWTATQDAHTLTIGASYRRDSARNDEFNMTNWPNAASATTIYSTTSGETSLLGVYVQDEWFLTPVLSSTLGLRHDSWTNRDGQIRTPGWTAATQINTDYAARTSSRWTPKAGLNFRISEALTLKASMGTAFRPPTVYELYRSVRFPSYRIVANAMLNPETTQTIDAGLDWKTKNDATVKLSLFRNDFRNLVYVQGAGAVRNRINLDRARSHGLMLGIDQPLSPASRMFASLTYTESEVLENSGGASSVGKRLTFLPKVQATAGYERQYESWTWTANARYVGKQFASDDNSDTATGVFDAYDAYYVVDTKASYRFDKNTTVSLAIDNLMDRSYFSKYPAPGRSWFLSLGWKY